MNLRLSPELAAALRAESVRSRRSQQDIVREAIAGELGLSSEQTPMQRAVQEGIVEAPDSFRDVEPWLTLSPGTSSVDLLDREDRI
jgi:hypothetical protein